MSAVPGCGLLFILSPADCSGIRATRLLAGGGHRDVSRELHGPDGVALGTLFSAVSSLYFRGKLEYAQHFAMRRGGRVRIVTPTRGLVDPGWRVDAAGLREFAKGAVDPRESSYRTPLLASAHREAEELDGAPVVFLGSLATDKYLDPLGVVFGDSISIPRVFVGMGNMKRGSILLNAVEAGQELEYVPARPPRTAATEASGPV